MPRRKILFNLVCKKKDSKWSCKGHERGGPTTHFGDVKNISFSGDLGMKNPELRLLKLTKDKFEIGLFGVRCFVDTKESMICSSTMEKFKKKNGNLIPPATSRSIWPFERRR